MKAARRYAKALFDAAIEQNKLPTIGEEVTQLMAFFQSSQELQDFLEDRIMPPQPKKDTLQKVFRGKMDPLMMDFLLLLTDKKRERYIREILAAFQTLVDEKNKIATAYVTSMIPLSKGQQEQIAKRLEKFSGYSIRIDHSLNPQLKGGFMIRLGDTVFDSSIAGQLDKLHDRLRQGEFK